MLPLWLCESPPLSDALTPEEPKGVLMLTLSDILLDEVAADFEVEGVFVLVALTLIVTLVLLVLVPPSANTPSPVFEAAPNRRLVPVATCFTIRRRFACDNARGRWVGRFCSAIPPRPGRAAGAPGPARKTEERFWRVRDFEAVNVCCSFIVFWRHGHRLKMASDFATIYAES